MLVMSFSRSRSIVLTMLAAVALVLPVSGVATADTAPQSFTPAQLIGPYPSDLPAGGTYLPVLDGFTELRDKNPALMAQNLQTVVRINNEATPAAQQDAIEINYDDRLVSLAAALGDKLGPVFLKLLDDGKLPKVAALAEGDLARAGLPSGTTLPEKQFFNNPRPFVAAPTSIKRYDEPGGHLYSELEGNGSYPSGHANMGYWKGALLASWLPELGPQIIARAGEIGLGRVVLGVHYPLDVMGGRLMAMDLTAARLSDPGFDRLIDEAGTQLREQLEKATGLPLAQFIATDTPYLTTEQAVSEHQALMTYGLPQVSPGQQNRIPAEAAALLRTKFPHLTDQQRLGILEQTAIPAGYPLDQAGPDGGWLRIDLAAAYAATP
ncbi:MAG: phosphoesterase [Gordonia sp.]|nr:phosphoesterase [Gordonia sp. (in: high G+C Gram-positive bacteria)]